MLKRVEPLRDELQSLEDQAEVNMKHAKDTKDLVTQLEQSIAAYKEEYAQLISQAQAIKTDLENVQAKVDRSIALLKSLNIERERWESTSETFRSQMSTIIGDVLLSAAFIAYGKYTEFFFNYYPSTRFQSEKYRRGGGSSPQGDRDTPLFRLFNIPSGVYGALATEIFKI